MLGRHGGFNQIRRDRLLTTERPRRTENFLSAEERILLGAVPATAPLPAPPAGVRGDEILIEVPGTAAPTLHPTAELVRKGERSSVWRIGLGGENFHSQRAGRQQSRISAHELEIFAKDSPKTRHSEVLRPDWLNLSYHPSIIPRYRRFRPADILVRPGIGGGGLATLYRGELNIGNDWPWCTAGKLFVGGNLQFDSPTAFASGVMVGPNLMLTASHAAPWDVSGWWMRFVPAYRDGAAPFGESYVSDFHGVRFADEDSDYVICRLYTPPTCGWMGSSGSTDDDFYEDRGWDSIGYPTDFFGGQRPAVEWNVTPEDADVSGSEVEITFSSPFTSGGWSGGPLFGWIDGQPRVVGITRGVQHIDYGPFGDDDDALFTGGILMVDLVKFGLANWPA
jgi:hypothetical protein